MSNEYFIMHQGNPVAVRHNLQDAEDALSLARMDYMHMIESDGAQPHHAMSDAVRNITMQVEGGHSYQIVANGVHVTGVMQHMAVDALEAVRAGYAMALESCGQSRKDATRIAASAVALHSDGARIE